MGMVKEEILMTFNNCERTSEEIQIPIKRFRIDGKPVCFSWWGSEDHPRQMCRFLMSSHFGTKLVCGCTGDSLFQDEKTHHVAPCNSCPIWEDDWKKKMKKKKKKDEKEVKI